MQADYFSYIRILFSPVLNIFLNFEDINPVC